MGQFQFTAPIFGAVWHSALGLLLRVSLCAAQPLQQPKLIQDPSAELPAPAEAAQDVLDTDLEQHSRADLAVPAMDTVVSSVSRQGITAARCAADVSLITLEMIRWIVHGVDDAQIDVNKWAIMVKLSELRSSRKFTTR